MSVVLHLVVMVAWRSIAAMSDASYDMGIIVVWVHVSSVGHVDARWMDLAGISKYWRR